MGRGRYKKSTTSAKMSPVKKVVKTSMKIPARRVGTASIKQPARKAPRKEPTTLKLNAAQPNPSTKKGDMAPIYKSARQRKIAANPRVSKSRIPKAVLKSGMNALQEIR